MVLGRPRWAWFEYAQAQKEYSFVIAGTEGEWLDDAQAQKDKI